MKGEGLRSEGLRDEAKLRSKKQRGEAEERGQEEARLTGEAERLFAERRKAKKRDSEARSKDHGVTAAESASESWSCGAGQPAAHAPLARSAVRRAGRLQQCGRSLEGWQTVCVCVREKGEGEG